MKRRIESRPASTRRPSAHADKLGNRVAEQDSRSPRMRRGVTPPDARGLAKRESKTQGSE